MNTTNPIAEATATLSRPANGRGNGNITKVEPSRATVLVPAKAKPAKSKKAKLPVVDETIDMVEVKNRKGRVYSLEAELFSHTGNLIPFANAKSAIDYLRLRKVGKAKAAVKKAKAEYAAHRAVHNTMICIVYNKLGKGFDLRRLTVRRLKKTPEVKAVAMSGRTESDIADVESFAQATAQGVARKVKLSK